MALLKQSTAYNRAFLMVDSTDHITGKTGLTITVTLSKNAAAFAAAGGTVTEISSGWYKIALTTTDTNTLGDLAFHATATGADATDFLDQVVAFDTQDTVRLGLTAMPNVASGSAGAIVTSGTGTAQLSVTSGLVTLAAVTHTGAVIPTVTTTTTATNLTNAPTNGDLTATMKTSVTTAATAATPTAAAVTGNVGGNVLGSVASLTTNNDKTGYTVAAGGIGSGAIAAAEKNNIADACLDRRLDVGTDSSADTTTGRTWRSALRQLRNKVVIATGVATTYKEDDATASHTAAITTTAGNPISTIDPT